MRGTVLLAGLAGAAVILAVGTPLRDQLMPIPSVEQVDRLEAKLHARISAGIEGIKAPPGEPQPPPDLVRPLDQYVRHYAFVTLRSEEDLPFTTIGAPSDDPINRDSGYKGPRIAGVLVLANQMGRPAGVVRTHRRDTLPVVFHRGCAVVNVVYDPATDRLIAASCNVP